MRQQKRSEVFSEVFGHNNYFLAHPLKVTENQRFSNVLRGWAKRSIRLNNSKWFL